MVRNSVPLWLAAHRHMQMLTLVCLVGLTAFAVAMTVCSAAGYIGWLALELRFGDWLMPQAGPTIQVGVTLFLVGLCFYLPAHARMIKLELSHRDFRMTMEDVARAYHASHAADRSGYFKMASEFDSIRERILHMREHPDLGALEPEILDLAAQMSHISRDLAEIYSDDAIERARLFLKQRMQEANVTRQRIEHGLQVSQDFRRMLDRVELEESVVESRLQMLREEFDDLMPRASRPGVAARQGAAKPIALRAAAE